MESDGEKKRFVEDGVALWGWCGRQRVSTAQATQLAVWIGTVLIVLLVVLGLVVALTIYSRDTTGTETVTSPPVTAPYPQPPSECNTEVAEFEICESIPWGAFNRTLNSPFPSTADSWLRLIRQATTTINVACFYLTLNQSDFDDDEGWEEWGHDVGLEIYNALIDAHDRGVTIRIVESAPASADSITLAESGVAEVRVVDMEELTGAGIIHSKFFIVDSRSFYTGSANMDWRSLTQVKELGISVTGSRCLSADFEQIFDLYWSLGAMNTLPSVELAKDVTSVTSLINASATAFIPSDLFPYATSFDYDVTSAAWAPSFSALFNQSVPAEVYLNDSWSVSNGVNASMMQAEVFLTSAPKSLCSEYRTNDLDAVAALLKSAEESICISVMDYAPTSLYESTNFYWGDIDTLLRSAAFGRGVKVRMLLSVWNHTKPAAAEYMKSLNAISNIEVRTFRVPDEPGVNIPFTRVNHAKYVTTEKSVLITTSNWSADYFLSTAGVSLVSDCQAMRQDVQYAFDRDWSSQYASELDCT